MNKVDRKLFSRLMILWLDLHSELAAKSVWYDMTYELVVKQTGDTQKAEKFADIALKLANEVHNDEQ